MSLFRWIVGAPARYRRLAWSISLCRIGRPRRLDCFLMRFAGEYKFPHREKPRLSVRRTPRENGRRAAAALIAPGFVDKLTSARADTPW
jgi:hypothetical protein